MEVDMQPIPLRATRSSTKRARSPSSPGQHDRPPPVKKRGGVSSGHDTSVPISFPPFPTSAASHGLPGTSMARLRHQPQDWVSQTQSMRLESPASEHSGFSTPVSDGGADVRIDEVMADEPMPQDDNAMSVSPPRLSRGSTRGPSPSPGQYLQPPDVGYPSPRAALHPQNPSRLQIPAIQIQAATPSPVQMYAQAPPDGPSLPSLASVSACASALVSGSGSDPAFTFEDTSMTSPTTTASPTTELCSRQQEQQEQQIPPTGATAKRRHFTMGPRADCELCRQRVKGHYMHFD
ncbi:hypothetical protein BD414DRAFT_141337 [Trametes punicea]|nr:hypothetical protein BD414DRAFT_141337 [Trametes punicea]